MTRHALLCSPRGAGVRVPALLQRRPQGQQAQPRSVPAFPTLATDSFVVVVVVSSLLVQVVKATEVTTADLEGYDVIFAAGGDGTFLKTASRVSRDVPIIGEREGG